MRPCLRTLLLMAVLCLTVLATLSLFSSPTNAAAIVVDLNGNGDYETVQEAVDNASSGDTIEVWEGYYDENVIVNRTVNLVGNGSEETVIRGGGEGNVLSVEAPWVNITGFYFTTGYTGVHITSPNVLVENCSSNNHSKCGISLSENASNCIIRNNRCEDNGDYGINIYQTSNHTITDNFCEDNDRYGVYVRYSRDNLFENNTLDGFYLFRNNFSSLMNNRCENGGFGIYLYQAENNSVTGNMLNSNSANGLILKQANHNSLVNNSCSFSQWEGIFVEGLSRWNIFEGNVVNENGRDGIEVFSSSFNAFLNNSCNRNTNSGIYVQYSDELILDNNSCVANEWTGIRTRYSQDSVLKNNVCTHNEWSGISVEIACDRALVENNYCYQNSGESALYLASENGTLRNNSCYGNNNRGISVISSNSSILDNHCTRNLIGLYLGGSSRDSLVRGNNLSENEDCGFNLIRCTHNRIDNNTISNNNNYGICSSNAKYNQIINNTIQNNKEKGIELCDANNCVITGNNISGSRKGIYFYCLNDNTASKNCRIYDNRIYDNKDYGMDATRNRGFVVNATDNWWGHDTGPFHEDKNPKGKGNNITDYVLVDPWKGSLFASILSIKPDPVLDTKELTLLGRGYPSSKVVRYAWGSSQDGELYNGTEPEFSTSTLSLGSHNISLQVQNRDGNWSEATHQLILVHSQPEAGIVSVTPNPATHQQKIKLVAWANDDGSVVRYVWWSNELGELYNGSEESVVIDPLPNGSHELRLKVQDDQGVWSLEASTIVSINGKPSARILSVSPSPALLDQDIVFKGEGFDDGEGLELVWRIIDASEELIYNGTSPPERPGQGNYRVFLAVKDGNGSWSKEVETTLVVHQQPRASIVSLSPTPLLIDETLWLKGSGSDDGNITNFQWKSDRDGIFGDSSEFGYKDLSLGWHQLSLRVRDDLGAWSNWTEGGEPFLVHQRPVARNLSISQVVLLPGDTLELSAEGLDDEFGSVVRYRWSSSQDGELYNGSEAEFTFNSLSLGGHIITLTVQDLHGAWSPGVYGHVNVTQRPVAVVDSISPAPALTTQQVTLMGSGIDDGEIQEYLWTITDPNGDDSTKKGPQAEVYWWLPGTHRIRLKVKDEHGLWSEEVEDSLLILKPARAVVNSSAPRPSKPGEEVQFRGEWDQHNEIDWFSWDFDDSDGINDDALQKNVSHIYEDPGSYTVSFTVRDSFGNQDTYTHVHWVLGKRLYSKKDSTGDLLDANDNKKEGGSPDVDITRTAVYDLGDSLLFEMKVAGVIRSDLSGMTAYLFKIYLDGSDRVGNLEDRDYEVFIALESASLQDHNDDTLIFDLPYYINEGFLYVEVPAEAIEGKDFRYSAYAFDYPDGNTDSAYGDVSYFLGEEDNGGFLPGAELWVTMVTLVVVCLFRKRKHQQ